MEVGGWQERWLGKGGKSVGCSWLGCAMTERSGGRRLGGLCPLFVHSSCVSEAAEILACYLQVASFFTLSVQIYMHTYIQMTIFCGLSDREMNLTFFEKLHYTIR